MRAWLWFNVHLLMVMKTGVGDVAVLLGSSEWQKQEARRLGGTEMVPLRPSNEYSD